MKTFAGSNFAIKVYTVSEINKCKDKFSDLMHQAVKTVQNTGQSTAMMPPGKSWHEIYLVVPNDFNLDVSLTDKFGTLHLLKNEDISAN